MGTTLVGRAIASWVLLAAMSALSTPARAAGAASNGTAEADPSARARASYDAGTGAFSENRFVEAALDFEAASEAKPSPIALCTAGISWERANAPERAADDYARSIALGELDSRAAVFAQQRLQALEAALGRAVVTAPPGWRVQLDAGTEVAAPATLHGGAWEPGPEAPLASRWPIGARSRGA
jgi:hypothetical protein